MSSIHHKITNKNNKLKQQNVQTQDSHRDQPINSFVQPSSSNISNINENTNKQKPIDRLLQKLSRNQKAAESHAKESGSYSFISQDHIICSNKPAPQRIIKHYQRHKEVDNLSNRHVKSVKQNCAEFYHQLLKHGLSIRDKLCTSPNNFERVINNYECVSDKNVKTRQMTRSHSTAAIRDQAIYTPSTVNTDYKTATTVVSSKEIVNNQKDLNIQNKQKIEQFNIIPQTIKKNYESSPQINSTRDHPANGATVQHCYTNNGHSKDIKIRKLSLLNKFNTNRVHVL